MKKNIKLDLSVGIPCCKPYKNAFHKKLKKTATSLYRLRPKLATEINPLLFVEIFSK